MTVCDASEDMKHGEKKEKKSVNQRRRLKLRDRRLTDYIL